MQIEQLAVGSRVYYKQEQDPVTIIHNEDGYIVIRRYNGAEVEPVKSSDLSELPAKEFFAKKVIDEKQWAKVFAHVRDAKPDMIDIAKLEYKLAAKQVDPARNNGSPLAWDALSNAAKCQFVAACNGLSVERLYKEFR